MAVTTVQKPSTVFTAGSAVSGDLHTQNTRLALHTTLVEKRVSEALGQHVFRVSGLGMIDDTGDRRRQSAELQGRAAA
jgi:hypothetical protein